MSMLYLINESVAWQVPPGHIEKLFRLGAYLPPDGWKVVSRLGTEVTRPGLRPKKIHVDACQASYIS
jgi:hypothetical protein